MKTFVACILCRHAEKSKKDCSKCEFYKRLNDKYNRTGEQDRIVIADETHVRA